MFSPERMYITLDSSACTSYPCLKRHKCIWRFGKATGLHELSSFLFSHSFFSSHNWLKSGITKKPEVVLHLSLLRSHHYLLYFVSWVHWCQVWRFSAEQLFITVNGELVSCLGRKNRASQLNPGHSDVYCSAVIFSRGWQPWRLQEHTRPSQKELGIMVNP